MLYYITREMLPSLFLFSMVFFFLFLLVLAALSLWRAHGPVARSIRNASEAWHRRKGHRAMACVAPPANTQTPVAFQRQTSG
jgi:hypothetical protein